MDSIIKINTKTKDAFDLFNSILNEDDDTSTSNTSCDELCYISGKPFDHSKTTLPCGHSFNYLPLINDLINFKKTHGYQNAYSYGSNYKYFACPYCRKSIDGTIPYRPDISKLSYNTINKPISASYIKHFCYNTECVNNATIPLDNNEYACYAHYKKRLNKSNVKTTKICKTNNTTELNNVKHQTTDNTHTKQGCSAILKTGNRKGEICNAKTLVANTNLCKRHHSNNQKS
jgi:hypothetical protein